MASYRFELNTTPNRNQKYNVLLCVTIGGKRKRIKTDIYLRRKADFNAKCKGNNWIRECEPNCRAWNEVLADTMEEARRSYKELKASGTATAENVALKVKGEEQSGIFLKIDQEGMTGFAAERTQQIFDAGGIRNWKKYVGFLRKLADFMSKRLKHKKELLFSEITPEFVAKFDAYLHTLHNARSKDASKMLHQNAIAVVLNAFRAMLRKGIELGYMTHDKDPFLVFKISTIKTEKEKLTGEEIKVLESLELEEGSLDWHSRNLFLFSFYCAGIRIGDLLLLRWMNVEGGRLKYQMGKNHKIRDMKLVAQAENILALYRTEASRPADYIFPLMDKSKEYARAILQADRDTLPSSLKKQMFDEISAKTSLVNKSLRRIAEKAGIKKGVTMHISRHSFASVAAQNGLESNKVKSMLGHSRLQTTEGYLGNFSTDEVDKALDSIFSTPADTAQVSVASTSVGLKSQLLALIQNMSEEEIASVLEAIRK